MKRKLAAVLVTAGVTVGLFTGLSSAALAAQESKPPAAPAEQAPPAAGDGCVAEVPPAPAPVRIVKVCPGTR